MAPTRTARSAPLDRAGTEPEMLHVLLVEPDTRFAQLIADQLPRFDARVTTVTTRDRALTALQSSFDAIVLEVDNPELDGFGLATAIRRVSSLPLVMIAATHDLERRIVGLSLGADDYLCRPFSTRELWARLQAHTRRARGEIGPGVDTISIGPLVVDRRAHRVRLRGRPLPLTSDELTLVRVLAEQRGRVLSREHILDLVKGSAEEAFDRAIDVRISRVRRKLGADADLIRTVRGVGYLMVTDVEEPAHEAEEPRLAAAL